MQVAGLAPEHAALLKQVFHHLTEGATSPGSPFRNLTLATATPDGAAPGMRTLVLRRFDPDAPALEFHTDARSPKMHALPGQASAHVWDAATRLQFRINGHASLASEPDAHQIWQSLPATTRSTYAVNAAPGTPIANPEDAARTLEQPQARANFRVIRLRIAELECLHLAPHQHRRARFTFASGSARATWLVP
jgi:pyridoxine/pyridoxamine 5'-phosphate oxidase